MVKVANQRIHGTTKKIPHEVFITLEKQYLTKLPENPYTFYVTLSRKVAANCHIHVDNNYYSVPSRLVGSLVEVRIQDHILSVFESEKSELVATHLLSSGTGEYVTNPSHYPHYKMYSQTALQAKFEEKMRSIGPYGHKLFLKVLQKEKGMRGITIKKILTLLPQYGTEKMELVIKRALSFNATSYKTLKNILENNLQNLEVEPTLLANRETGEINQGGAKKEEQLKEDQTKKTTNEAKQADSSLTRDLSYYTKKQKT